jgi:hypothetical protein
MQALSRGRLHRSLGFPAVGDDPCHDRVGVGTCRHDRGPLDDGAAGGMSSRQASDQRSNRVVVHAYHGATTTQSAVAGSSARVSLGIPAAAACFLASFLACFRARRSRTAFSRLCFAIVVRFFELDAI